ncbi:glucosamine-6-phosphate deaminase [Salinibacillus xinjiangensis]|uniref:Glucosamine-6-phosphate deaminase n=1 Tax=Salinibacillus xinjiangensis TaxID=1229268 RepID=A0A6G1X218_9BACI|nr:glucosamine-6-phosphate deaminase [Salinibacillus xinjiangensis]MRG84936.1 glucosamine-6-phosphate deaminase [Salinibacillus xinjiangensis]
MKIVAVKNYDEMSEYAAHLLIKQITQKPSTVLGLATGSTPTGTYERLIQDHKDNQTSYEQVRTVNLDEYVGLSPDDPNSYRYFMEKNLFKHINVRPENTYIPNGKAESLEQECTDYEKLVQELGVDVQILGIGVNGHIGFNEPGTSFQSKTHIVKLAESTRQANARFFDSMDEVPTSAITMGIESILKSKEIVLLVSGKNKAGAMKQLVTREIDESFPASALHQHPNVTVIADSDALAECKDLKGSLQMV